jgi:hypothetical protein
MGTGAPTNPERISRRWFSVGDLALSLRAQIHAPRLDQALARGANPDAGRLLRRRSYQLTSEQNRRCLARALKDLVRRADEPTPPSSSSVSIRKTEVRSCAPALLRLADRLCDDRVVDAQGVAMARQLLTDARSPLYFDDASHTLSFVARRAWFALAPPTTPAPSMRADAPTREASAPRSRS